MDWDHPQVATIIHSQDSHVFVRGVHFTIKKRAKIVGFLKHPTFFQSSIESKRKMIATNEQWEVLRLLM